MRCLLSPVLGWLAVSMRVGFVSALRARHDATSVRPGPDDSVFSQALSCLRLTSPSLELRYPEDAEEHMEEIRQAMAPFQPENVYGNRTIGKYHLEHVWMQFHQHWTMRKSNGSRLRDVFGPYVPIFTHFVEPWFVAKPNGRFIYPTGFWETLRRVLRKDVPYITASASDTGLTGRSGADNVNISELANVLVLSGGGYGHVPVPLWKEYPEGGFRSLALYEPPGPRPLPRTYFMNYVGSMVHAPGQLRAHMKEAIQGWADTHSMSVTDEPDPVTLADVRLNRKVNGRRNVTRNATDLVRLRESGGRFLFYNNKSGDARMVWQEAMLSSRFSLTPRGYGRTSYHLAEILLFGLVPIHIYTDVPWIPYRRIYETIGFHTTVAAFPKLLDRLATMSDEELHVREAAAKAHAESHYLEQPMKEQILRFMSGRNSKGVEAGAGDLECVRLPSTVRDEQLGDVH